MKTAKIELLHIKSHGWWDLGYELFGSTDASDEAMDKVANKINSIFEWGEFGNIEIEIDEDLNIIGGRVIPHEKQ